MAKRRLCLGPAGAINCPPLSALSFWVSLFPGMHGYNTITPFTKYPTSLPHAVLGPLSSCVTLPSPAPYPRFPSSSCIILASASPMPPTAHCLCPGPATSSLHYTSTTLPESSLHDNFTPSSPFSGCGLIDASKVQIWSCHPPRFLPESSSITWLRGLPWSPVLTSWFHLPHLKPRTPSKSPTGSCWETILSTDKQHQISQKQLHWHFVKHRSL